MIKRSIVTGVVNRTVQIWIDCGEKGLNKESAEEEKTMGNGKLNVVDRK